MVIKLVDYYYKKYNLGPVDAIAKTMVRVRGSYALELMFRDMQDTFFIQHNPDVLLRTHTSSVQTRVMENQEPPIRIICPGRVYRNEAISYRAHCFFHQVEALYVDKNVSFADLKQALLFFAKEMFSADTKIRLRPSYFPFTEPSAEMDISCNICGGKGCPFCKEIGRASCRERV